MAYSSSASDRLVAVRAAIDAALSAQEYWLNGRKVRRADLQWLMQLETRLQWEVADGDGSMAPSLIQVDAPT